MSLYKLQSKNVRKTFFLMGVFFIIFIAVGWFFSWYFNNPLLLIIIVSISVFSNIYAYMYSDKLAIKLTGAREVKREEFFDCYNLIENLSISLGIKTPRLYIIDDKAPNAFATGRNPENSIIVVTAGLLDILDKNELEGVLAHELAHIVNRDTLIMTVTVVLVGIITILIDFFLRAMLFNSGGRSEKGGLIAIVGGLIILIIAPIFVTLLRFSISRKREFLADATGAIYTRYPEGLASALEKISKSNTPMKRANTATAHLFISDPFGKGQKSMLAGKVRNLFATHPPVEDRIKALRSKV